MSDRSREPDRPWHRAVVLAGGEPPPPGSLDRVLAAVRDDDPAGRPLVVAADSGLDLGLALGLPIDLVVGDLDSASPAGQAAARRAGTAFEVHPVAKDATDLELALLAARDRGARHVTVIGGGGGRHDHLIANALVLGVADLDEVDVEALVGTARITVVRAEAALHGRPGSLCSLIPVGGVARGVRTEGLRYALDDDDLRPGSTRGISNELLGTVARVTLAHGVLLAVQPDALSPTPAEEA